MTAFACVSAVALAILWMDLRPKWKAKPGGKSFTLSLLFLALGWGILSLTSFNLPLPSPLTPVTWLIQLLTGR